ncbi:MAG: Uncharacterized protein G01um101433_960 [Parcubacteria group bacterium Gr01-1014_33]|nr:MAG: Uncharacterized protein G01um101433_960 [Parcubacteria group bacterium Gr01-1014_33]
MANGNDNTTTFIGKTNFRSAERIFGINAKDRRQHIYVIGKTGVGKTVLLKNMALQDIRAGHGICIIDPHGEFAEEVLAQIPSERTNDVIYFNPVDADYPIGFNVLEVPDVRYKHLIVSDLLGIFTKIWANVWSARMEYILQNCILALIDTPGTTLLGIPRILVDKDYREKIIANVKDPVVRSFWVHEYETWRDQFRNEAIVPIQNKVGQFLNTGFIRNIVGQSKSTLNIPEIMNTGKILLVNVSKGKIGEDNSALLGAMIITKIQLAAMERVRIAEEERRDFYLYVDEFQNFATDSFASILSEARKYRLNLIIAHQYVGQLVTDNSTKVRDAVFGNVGTMISFRVGAADAEELEKEFTPEFMQQDLINLPNHQVYLKLMVGGITSRPFSATTLAPLQFETDPGVKEKIIRVSRERYTNPRTEVEEKIARWSGMIGDDGAFPDSSVAVSSSGPSEAQCWNCGKMTTVPFKPDGKRPVYCESCYKQIQDGKLIPLPERMPQVGRARFSDSLGTLGIEFTAPTTDRRPRSMQDESKETPKGVLQGRGREAVARRSAGPSRSSSGEPVQGRKEQVSFPSRPLNSWQSRRVGREDNRDSRGIKLRALPTDRPSVRETQWNEKGQNMPQKMTDSRPLARPLPQRKISLSELVAKKATTPEKKEAPSRPRAVPDVLGLRKVLGEFLRSDQAIMRNKRGISAETESRKNSSNGAKRVVQPGETVKF